MGDREKIVFSVGEALIKSLKGFENLTQEEIFEQRKKKFLNIGKEKSFMTFSKDPASFAKKYSFLRNFSGNRLINKQSSFDCCFLVQQNWIFI